MNPSNRFAYLNSRFWKVTNFERMHDWEEGRASGGYPLTNQPGPWAKHPNAMPPELLFQETEHMLGYRHITMPSYKMKFPEQGVEILYEDPNWVYASWMRGTFNANDLVDGNGGIIVLGACNYVVWKHWSDYTGETIFLSITPMEGFPPTFCNQDDLTLGVISPQHMSGKQDMTKFLVERIVPGMERSKTIHFKVIETIGPPLVQPKGLRFPELIA